MSRLRRWLQDRKARRHQKTFIYCPSCKFEMVAGGEWLGQEVETFHEAYRCNKCGTLSIWDFDLPAPVVVSWGLRSMAGHNLAPPSSSAATTRTPTP